MYLRRNPSAIARNQRGSGRVHPLRKRVYKSIYIHVHVFFLNTQTYIYIHLNIHICNYTQKSICNCAGPKRRRTAWFVSKTCLLSLRVARYEWVMSHMSESCHIWVSHVTYEWVMSRMNQSRYVTYEWVTSRMNAPCAMWIKHLTYECVMLHMIESCHISEVIMGSLSMEVKRGMNTLMHINVSCYIWLSHVTYQRFWWKAFLWR